MPNRIEPDPLEPTRPPAAPQASRDMAGPRPGRLTSPRLAVTAARQAPAWAISMLVHVVALLAMALIVSVPPTPPRPPVIISSQPDAIEDYTDLADELPDQQPLDLPAPEADLAATAEVAVTPVDVVTNAPDLDAAPLAVELVDVGTESAPATDMLARVGALGGKASGLGGRAQAATLAAARGGGGKTERAVQSSLTWIAAHQLSDGGWSFGFRDCPSCGGMCSGSGGSRAKDRTGATALALLPFLGRGYTHREGPYQATVEKGIAFLAQRALGGKGKAYDRAGNLYSQALASIALSECYAMSQDGRLAAPAQLTLNFIMQAQDPVGGGWRYEPRQPGDTSAVGWQIMALKSGDMAYLHVSPLTVKKSIGFLNAVESQGGARYGYLDNSRFRPSLTAVGLLCRMYLGWKKDHPALLDGVAYLAKTGPTHDLYYDYYATQIMYHLGGEAWDTWNERMKEMLLGAQAAKDHETGSWHTGFHEGHAPEAAGRLYSTSLATLILEVYYRFLPMYAAEMVEREFAE